MSKRFVIGFLMLMVGGWGVASNVLYLRGDLSRADAIEIQLAHVWAWISGLIAAGGFLTLVIALLLWLESGKRVDVGPKKKPHRKSGLSH